MYNRNILLTYMNKEKRLVYGWFEDEEELKDFVNNTDDVIEINDCLDCSNCRDIEIEVKKS